MLKNQFLSILLLGVVIVGVLCVGPVGSQSAQTTIKVDTNSAARPFPHWWEHMFGSGRAALSLRESYRDDLRKVKSVLPVDYIRFHAIFHDELGVYDEDKNEKPIYNFSYVDQVYDGLLKNGVRPYVELSFMPNKLAEKPEIFGFWYKPNVAPPKDWKKWDDLLSHFATHLIERYGIEEVSKWYFEVWNEPNIGFWEGNPREETYYKLYDESAKTLKGLNSRLRVGGPSTAQAAWCDKFIAHCVTEKIPVDFVATHVYANDSAEDVFNTHEKIPRRDMVARAMKKVYDQVKASARPDLPIIWSEFNASFFFEPEVTDSTFMGPWLANHIREADGLANMVSYWTFSDVFEENGVVKNPFYGGFGLIAAGGIPKPSFNAFKLLHMLGDKRLDVDCQDALITKRDDGTVVVAVWNYFAPEESGQSKQIELDLSGMSQLKRARIYTLDTDHGDARALFQRMGKPDTPTREQQKQLRDAAELSKFEEQHVTGSSLTLTLQPKGLSIIEFLK